MIDFEKLKAPFPGDRVSWRVGSTNREKTKGMALAYIDARDVMERLDDVCTPAGWQCRYPHANGKTVCEVGIRINNEWVWKSDGAGDTDFEAEKGALSDAFKRAAVRWGIGRYLYDLDAPWVRIEAWGKSFRIVEDDQKKLAALLGKKAPVKAPTYPAAEPAMRPNTKGQWNGPRNKSTLEREIREFSHDMEGCADADQLEALVATNEELLEQCRKDWPACWLGEADHRGVKKRIEERRAELNPANYINAA